jgi:hypothetical protein
VGCRRLQFWQICRGPNTLPLRVFQHARHSPKLFMRRKPAMNSLRILRKIASMLGTDRTLFIVHSSDEVVRTASQRFAFLLPHFRNSQSATNITPQIPNMEVRVKGGNPVSKARTIKLTTHPPFCWLIRTGVCWFVINECVASSGVDYW